MTDRKATEGPFDARDELRDVRPSDYLGERFDDLGAPPAYDGKTNMEYAPPGTCKWAAKAYVLLKAYMGALDAAEEEVSPEVASRAALRCIKCGSEDIRTRYHRRSWPHRDGCLYDDLGKRLDEHLHRYCQGCHYDWADAVLTEVAA